MAISKLSAARVALAFVLISFGGVAVAQSAPPRQKNRPPEQSRLFKRSRARQSTAN